MAVDPEHPNILLAASNSFSEHWIRVYSSANGGRTWWSNVDPPLPPGCYGAADPVVGIDPTGSQYVVLLELCRGRRASVAVSSRPSASAPWSTPVLVAPPNRGTGQDKDALAVDTSPTSPHRGRVYVAWTHHLGPPLTSSNNIEVNWSSDHGRTWSRPVVVSHTGVGALTFASLAVAANGDLYVAWLSTIGFSSLEVMLSRSADGGTRFTPPVSVAFPSAGTCNVIGWSIPAARTNCPTSDPVVSVDDSSGRYAGRVFVTYGDEDASSRLHVFVAAFTPDLRPLLGAPDSPDLVLPHGTLRSADQFLPVSAVDPKTGDVWVCFYDTTGSLTGRETRFSCSISTNGGKNWGPVIRAASGPSNEEQPGAFHSTTFGGFGTEYGDYEGLAVLDGTAHPMWTDSRKLGIDHFGEEIYTSALTLGDFVAQEG